MPPKVKISKEDIVNKAIDVVRRDGDQAINARHLANLLECSTQPIFSNFSTMEELREAVLGKAYELCNDYIKSEIENGIYPTYKASGMAYIRFAKEEKELFKMLYMCDRLNQPISEKTGIDPRMETIVRNNTGLGDEEARLFHLEMWAYVHGIATMLATGFVGLEWELVSRMLTDSYLGLRKQYGLE